VVTNYSYDRRSIVAASVLHEIARNLNEQFGKLVQNKDTDGLVREEAKMVREFQAGIRALRERLGLIKKSTGFSAPLPEAALSLVWTTSEKEASTALQRAIQNYEEAIQTATLAAISAERWFADNILAIDPQRTLFNWPSFH
jgi:hypothetical protein